MKEKEFNYDSVVICDEAIFKRTYELLVDITKRIEAEKIRLIKLENDMMSFIRHFEWLCDCESVGINKKIFNEIHKK